jgi:hypothetical protein
MQQFERKKIKSIIRRPKGRQGISIRTDKPELKRLAEIDALPHSQEDFEKFKDIFWENMKPLIRDFADGTIVDKLNKDPYESIASLERSYRKGFKITFADCDQSRHIRMGNILEKTWRDFLRYKINSSPQERFSDEEKRKLHENLKDESGRETRVDDQFKYRHVVFGFEYKTNLNLDTEKAPAVIERQKRTQKALDEVCGGGVSAIISLLAPTIREVKASGKYKEIKGAVFGYQEALNLFGISFSVSEYEKLLIEAEKKCEEEFDEYNSYRNFGRMSD